jgi:diguanylate cyclase (GGDEF)-like protein
MRKYFSRLGRNGTVFAITLASVLISAGVTWVMIIIMNQIGVDVHTASTLFVGISVPMIVAPTVSWAFVGMTMKIHQLEEEMRRLATQDSLTGLLNRHGFMERAEYFVKIAERGDLEFSVLFIDLDYFKEINDQYGHAVGDRVLASFGDIVRSNLRESDLACRLGGDEFLFFLPKTTSEQGWNFSERLHNALRQKKDFNGKPIRYTASMGLTSYPEIKTGNLEELFKAADKALYRAKMKGKNQTVIYNADHYN